MDAQMEGRELRKAIVDNDAQRAHHIWTGSPYRYYLFSILPADQLLWLFYKNIVRARRVIVSSSQALPLHCLVSDARIRKMGGDTKMEQLRAILHPAHRHLLDLELEIDDPDDAPDVRTTALRYCLTHDFHAGTKLLLKAGASTDGMCGDTDGRNVLKPYTTGRTTCARSVAALLCVLCTRKKTGKDVALLVAALAWEKRYSRAWWPSMRAF